MSEIKVMNNDEIRDFCIKKDLKIFELEQQLQQKENVIKEVREYITFWHYRNDFRVNSFTTGVKEELLEILDKANDREDK